MKIAIPTDFSPSARKAFEYASVVYGDENPEFYLINSFESPNSGGTGALMSLEEILEKEAKKDLRREMAYLEENHPDLSVEPVAIYGKVENAVKRVNKRQEIDVVVMGTEGASGIKEAVFGSNTERVINHVVKPVIAVPGHFEIKAPKNIVYAADYRKIRNIRSLAAMVHLAKKYDSEIHVLHICEKEKTLSDQEEMCRRELDAILGDIDHSFHIRVNADPVEGIHEYAESVSAEMTVLMPRKMGFFKRLLTKKVSRGMAYKAMRPILILHDTEE